jgi:hypothetical protein
MAPITAAGDAVQQPGLGFWLPVLPARCLSDLDGIRVMAAKARPVKRGHQPSPKETDQLKRLNRRFDRAKKFKLVWAKASLAVRRKFITVIMKLAPAGNVSRSE